MMMHIDIAWKSLNKYGEELCGDKVEIVHAQDSDILVLSDGLGSGVKANILASLTSKIIITMLQEGLSVDEAVDTIAHTLPICKVRHIAYSTFSILQLFHDGRAYLVEFDNPACIFIRGLAEHEHNLGHALIRGKAQSRGAGCQDIILAGGETKTLIPLTKNLTVRIAIGVVVKMCIRDRYLSNINLAIGSRGMRDRTPVLTLRFLIHILLALSFSKCSGVKVLMSM